MFRRCEFSASGKGSLLVSEINAVLYIMDLALQFPVSQGDFNQFWTRHWIFTPSHVVGRLCLTCQLCPQRMNFQRATYRRIKPGRNLVMSLYLLQQVSGLKLPPGLMLFHLLPSLHACTAWVSQQWAGAKTQSITVSKSHGNGELVLELKK